MKSDRKLVLRIEILRSLSTSDLMNVHAGADLVSRPIAFDTEEHNCHVGASVVVKTKQ
jgi:hypothetical protein